MSISLTSFALGTVFGLALGALGAIAWSLLLDHRDRKRKRQQEMDEACNELERGEWTC